MVDISSLSKDEKIKRVIDDVYYKRSINTIHNTIFPNDEFDDNVLKKLLCPIIEYINFILDVGETSFRIGIGRNLLVSTIPIEDISDDIKTSLFGKISEFCKEYDKVIYFYDIKFTNNTYKLLAAITTDDNMVKKRQRNEKIDFILKNK